MGSGRRNWKSPGSTLESRFAPAALLPGARKKPGGAREAEGTPSLAAAPPCLLPSRGGGL